MAVAAVEEEEVSSNRSVSPPSLGERFSNRISGTLSTKPLWLSSTLADIEQRFKLLATKNTEEEDVGDTFAERAECYYQKRPQLLSLLQDLYTAYTTLSDRYIQTAAKHYNHHHCQSSITSTNDHDSFDPAEDSGISQIESDAESSLSYQQLSVTPAKSGALLDGDIFLAELVIKNVEYDILMNEVRIMERQCSDSSRKIELQKSLLEVLESERLILLNENARLEYRVASLMEENKGLVAESVFMKRKAGEMARCMLKMRDDHRVFLLSQKVADLQGQIYGLEKRNKEYYEQLVQIDRAAVGRKNGSKDKEGNGVALEACFQIGKLKFKRDNGVGSSNSHGGKKVHRWWAKARGVNMFLCGHSSNPT